jgi:hypothetical protein
MTSLVDRYVYTALRRVPEQQRTDIDRELRASIEDAVEARIEAGEEHEAAVESALLELGDPGKLADRYADRPNYLIGPELFGIWRRLLVTLLSTVLPVVVVIVVIVQLIEDPQIGKVIGSAITALITVGVHLGFWTTGVFAVLERTGQPRSELGGLTTTWSLKDLPKYERTAMPLHELLAGLIWIAVLIGALILQQFTFTLSDVPVLDPGNWTFWWPFLIVTLVLRGAWAVWANRIAVWTRTAAVANGVLNLLFAVPVIVLLATDHFFNPAFHGFAVDGTTDVKHWLTVSTIVVIALGTAWDIFDVARKAEQARRLVRVEATGAYR